ncbi:MAG: hypothetical protein BYD32DRAFT_214990 [Podila humilis]|nr:MAG: hypothetical protein BYD32DRAFT_214990 [Podila humilis]
MTLDQPLPTRTHKKKCSASLPLLLLRQNRQNEHNCIRDNHWPSICDRGIPLTQRVKISMPNTRTSKGNFLSFFLGNIVEHTLQAYHRLVRSQLVQVELLEYHPGEKKRQGFCLDRWIRMRSNIGEKECWTAPHSLFSLKRAVVPRKRFNNDRAPHSTQTRTISLFCSLCQHPQFHTFRLALSLSLCTYNAHTHTLHIPTSYSHLAAHSNN